MYSHEDRMRAVQLYIRLGQRVGLTIRQLGYPTKNSLKSWHREYVQRLALHVGHARRPKYSQEQKERAIKHYRDSGRCLSMTIKELGYPSRTLLSAWVREQHPEAYPSVVSRSQKMSAAMKRSAVTALCMREASAQSVAQDLGVSPAAASGPSCIPIVAATTARIADRRGHADEFGRICSCAHRRSASGLSLLWLPSPDRP